MGPPEARPDEGIALERVTKRFADGVVAVRDLNLEIAPGEFVILVGPSGCGKSTTLRIVAGLEKATEGTIRIGGRVVDGLPPRSRDIAMVFQNYALYAHMTVGDNIGFGLKMTGTPKKEIRRRVQEAAAMLGLTEQLARKPRQLSGGQRQRVAMGRAIVRDPAAFLMDEPLSNLDAKLRVDMREEIIRVQREIGAPTLYVTHDQTEAMTMADRVAILRDGVLEQVGAPDELYDAPVNLFVASFMGSPTMNFLPGEIMRQGERYAVDLGGVSIAVPASVQTRIPRLAAFEGKKIILGVRPEGFVDAAAPGAHERIPIDPQRNESLGSDLMLYFELPGVATVSGLRS